MVIQAQFKQQQEVFERGAFKSRKVWLTMPDDKYPQTLEVELHQDKVDMFAGLIPGTPVTCHLNLRGREWTNPQGEVKVFNTLVCWKADFDSRSATAKAIYPSDTQQTDVEKKKTYADDDLPF